MPHGENRNPRSVSSSSTWRTWALVKCCSNSDFAADTVSPETCPDSFSPCSFRTESPRRPAVLRNLPPACYATKRIRQRRRTGQPCLTRLVRALRRRFPGRPEASPRVGSIGIGASTGTFYKSKIVTYLKEMQARFSGGRHTAAPPSRRPCPAGERPRPGLWADKKKETGVREAPSPSTTYAWRARSEGMGSHTPDAPRSYKPGGGPCLSKSPMDLPEGDTAGK